MKYLLIPFILLIFTCAKKPTGPDGMKVTFPVTYIEWEAEHPQDTTWWTFSSNKTLMSAWKRKLTEVSGAPPWEPYCFTRIDPECVCCVGDAWRTNEAGEIIDYHGRTLAEYQDYWAAQIAGFLPIEFSVGTWGSADGMKLTVAVNRVVPGSYGGIACDLQNPTYVTSQYEPKYVMYDFWTTDSLFGYQSYDTGDTLWKQNKVQLVRFSQWHGQHLYEKTNPIFKQF